MIRTATANDAKAIMNVIENVYTEYGFIYIPEEETPDLLSFEKNYNHHSSTFFVFIMDNQIVGTVGVKFVEEDTTEIKRLYLNVNFRGKGIGQKLLETAMDWARKNGSQKMILWSDTRFILAHKLYERTGFDQTDLRKCDDINNSLEYHFVRAL